MLDIVSYDCVSSTMDQARVLLDEGKAPKFLVTARSQAGGRGRRGRQWSSPVGNLYMTLVLYPDFPMTDSPQVSFVVSLALARLFERIIEKGQHQIQCKWPNDVLVNGCKVSGVLLETVTNSQNKFTALLVGVGVNVEDMPSESRLPATSLRALGCTLGLNDIRDALIEGINVAMDEWRSHGFGHIRGEWCSRAYAIDEPISLCEGDTVHKGIFRGIDQHGMLLLEQEGGPILRLPAGDMQVHSFQREDVYDTGH